MLKEEQEVLKQMLHDYGNNGFLRELVSVIKSRANDQSDMGLKEQAQDSMELADLLLDVYYSI